jgi:Kef-type K+ transport system membrane component KefB
MERHRRNLIAIRRLHINKQGPKTSLMEPLLHLAIIWAGVLFAVFAAKKTRLTPVLYFLAVGAILVNLGILPENSHPFIRGFSEIGMILIMFALGFEESTENFLAGVKRAWGIALFGAIAPFFTAYFVAQYFWADTNMALIFGLTMTATAVSLTMVSLKEEGLQSSKVANGIMTSAVIDSVSSLALVAVLIPIATGAGPATFLGVSQILGKTMVFFFAISLIGAWVLPHEPKGLVRWFPKLGRFGIKHILSLSDGQHATLIILTFALFIGLAAHWFGLHPAVGAYMAGLILKEEYFHTAPGSDQTPNGSHYQFTKGIIDNVAFSWIGPVFFVDLGTKIILKWDVVISVIPQTMVLLGAIFIVQIASAALAARYTGKFEWRESMMIGFGMLGRAELAFVVMDIAYVQNAILSEQAFYTLMFTAFWLNVSVPVTIAWWKPYYLRKKTLMGRTRSDKAGR